jgi:hypothetical protein
MSQWLVAMLFILYFHRTIILDGAIFAHWLTMDMGYRSVIGIELKRFLALLKKWLKRLNGIALTWWSYEQFRR